MTVSVSIKMSPKMAGKMYMEHCAMAETIESIQKAIHWPDCWDTTAYPTLIDAIKEIGCNPRDCTKSAELFERKL